MDKTPVATSAPLILQVNNKLSSVLPEQKFLPDAYRLPEGSMRGPIVEVRPKVIFIEVRSLSTTKYTVSLGGGL